MSWQVAVCGPQGILAELAHAFHPGVDPCLTCRDAAWVLESPRFESLPDAEAVRSLSVEVVTTLSAFARVRFGSTAPITVGSVWDVKPDGSRAVYAHVEGVTAKAAVGAVSVVVTHKDGTVEKHRPTDRSPEWVSRALADPEVARALRLRNAASLSWTDLYRIFEIVCAGVGGTETLTKRKWTTRSRIRLFKHTADSVAASGDQARHGVEATDPPPTPMSLADAGRFIDELLERWIEHGAA